MKDMVVVIGNKSDTENRRLVPRGKRSALAKSYPTEVSMQVQRP